MYMLCIESLADTKFVGSVFTCYSYVHMHLIKKIFMHSSFFFVLFSSYTLWLIGAYKFPSLLCNDLNSLFV